MYREWDITSCRNAQWRNKVMEIIVTINVRSVVRSYIMQSAVYSNFSSAVQTFYAVITGIQNVSIESPAKIPDPRHCFTRIPYRKHGVPYLFSPSSLSPLAIREDMYKCAESRFWSNFHRIFPAEFQIGFCFSTFSYFCNQWYPLQ